MLDRFEGFGRGRKQGDLRASDANRQDAIRRLKVHESMGHLREREAVELIEAVEAAKTPNEIAKAFVNLPELPAHSPSSERRISLQNQEEAIAQLEAARREGRITADECKVATVQIQSARTQNELDAAFHGLSTPSRTRLKKAISSLTLHSVEATAQAREARAIVAAERRKRASKAFRHGVYGAGAFAIGMILLIAGYGAGALLFVLGSVVLFVIAATSLATSR